jgi:hypothetical protein
MGMVKLFYKTIIIFWIAGVPQKSNKQTLKHVIQKRLCRVIFVDHLIGIPGEK